MSHSHLEFNSSWWSGRGGGSVPGGTSEGFCNQFTPLLAFTKITLSDRPAVVLISCPNERHVWGDAIMMLLWIIGPQEKEAYGLKKKKWNENEREETRRTAFHEKRHHEVRKYSVRSMCQSSLCVHLWQVQQLKVTKQCVPISTPGATVFLFVCLLICFFLYFF